MMIIKGIQDEDQESLLVLKNHSVSVKPIFPFQLMVKEEMHCLIHI
jgi:hypothetical protein